MTGFHPIAPAKGSHGCVVLDQGRKGRLEESTRGGGTGCPNEFFRIRDSYSHRVQRGASAPPVILGDDATTKRRNIPVAQLLLRELRPTLLRRRIRCRCCCRHPRRQPPLPTGLGLWACRPRNVTKSSTLPKKTTREEGRMI